MLESRGLSVFQDLARGGGCWSMFKLCTLEEGPWPGGAREGGLNSANLAPGLLPLPELPRYLQLCTLLCLLLAPVPSEVRIVNASQRTVGDPARDLEVSGPWCPDGDPWIPGATLSRFLMLGLLPGD